MKNRKLLKPKTDLNYLHSEESQHDGNRGAKITLSAKRTKNQKTELVHVDDHFSSLKTKV